MANAKLNIDVGYTIDKNSFNQLLENLDKVTAKAKQMTNDKNGDANLKKQFQEAGKAAEQLYVIMNRSWDGKLNQVNLTKLNTEFKNTGITATDFYNKLAKGGREGAESANNFARSILNANIQLKQSNQLLDKMAVTFKNTVRYGISSSIFNNFTNSIQKAYDFTKNLDTSLNDIRIVSGKSADEMGRLAISANKAAQALGKTTLDYTKAATIYYQQGLSTEEVEKRTEATLKAANVTGQNAQEVSEQLTAVWNGYQVTGEKLEEYVDKLAAVAASSASDLEELSTGMSKVASAANIMGVDIDQLTAQMSTIISVTRQAPESVGTALRTIYARIADIKAGLDDETTLGNYSGKMKKLGFDVLDASGNLKDMGDVIEEIGGKWQDLTREQQISLAQTMAGTRQYNNLLTLFDNWDKYEEALEVSSNAAGTLQKQQDIYMESTEAHLEQLRAEAEELYNALFDQEAVRGFVDLLHNGLDILGNYVKSLSGGMGALIGLGSQLANIFSGQIASSINNMMTNAEIMAQNDNDKALKDEISKVHAVEGDYISEAALTKELEYANKIKEVRGALNAETLNELTSHQKKIGLLEEEKIKNDEILKQLIKKRDSSNQNNKNVINELNEENPDFNVNDTVSVTNLLESKQGNIERLHDEEKTASEERLSAIHQEIDAEDRYIDFLQQRKQLSEEIDTAKATGQNLKDEQQAYEDIAKAQIEQAERQQAIQNIIKGTTALLMTMTSVKSIFSIITDNDLSTWDKFKSIIGILVMQIPTLVTSFNSLKKMKQSLLLLTTKSTAAQTAETTATIAGNTVETASTVIKQANVDATGAQVVATGAETVATNAQTTAENAGNAARLVRNMLDHAWLSMGIVAAIGAVVLGLGALINNLLNTKTQEEKLKEAIEESNEKLKDAKDKYNELKDTISNYQSAKEGINNLTEGTVEFYDAIIKANEEAQKLIDKWGLLANQDYTIDKNGLIHIDEDVLKDRQFEEQQTVFKASAQNTQARLELQKYYANEQIKNFQNEINKNGKYKYEISFDQAKTILDDYYKISQETAQNTSDSVKAIGEMSEKVLTPWDYYSTQQETTNDITEAIKTYAPSYGSISAQSKALNNQLSDELIRAYGSQAQVDKYNNTSSRQKEIIQGYLSQQRTNFQSPGSLNEYVEGKYFTSGSGWDNMEETIQNYLSQKYGYNYDEKSEQWSKNGRFIDNDEIENLIDELGGFTDAYKAALKEEYVTGNYGTAGNLNKVLEYIDKAIAKANAAGLSTDSLSYVAEAYSAKKTGVDYNYDLLTNEEKRVVNSLLESDVNTWTQDFMNGFNIFSSSSLLEMGETENRSFERQKADAEAYNLALKEQAETLETTSSALEIYAAAMVNANKLTNNQTESMANAIAASYKFNKSYNEAVKVYEKNTDAIEEWTKAWENHEMVSAETADSIAALYEELQGVFSKDFSVDVMLNNMDLVKQMLTGTKEEAEAAYRALESLNIQDIFKRTFGQDAIDNIFTTENALSEFADHVSNLKFGESIGDKYFEQLKKMVNASEMTKEQVENLFSSMNLKVPDLKVTNKPVTIPGTKTRHVYSGQYPYFNTQTGELERAEDFTYEWTEEIEPKTENFVSIGDNVKANTVTSTGGGNFSKAPSNSGKSKKKGGGGGSKAKPSKKDPNKDELDRYQLVNVQLKEISKQLSKLDKEKKKLLGGNLVKNLNKQIKLLNSQITVTEKKLKIAKGEQAEVAKTLSGYGVKFDKDGNVANYKQIFQREQNKLNKVYSNYNNMSKKEQENYETTVKAAEERFKKFKDSISRYDTLIGDVIPGLEQDKIDAYDKITEDLIEEFNMEIKIRLDLADAKRDWNKFKGEIVNGWKDSDIDKWAGNLLKDFSILFNEEGNGTVTKTTQQLQKMMEEVKNVVEKKGIAQWYRDNGAKAMEDFKDDIESLQKEMTKVREAIKQMDEYLVKAIDLTQDKFDDQLNNFEAINKQLQHNIELVNLLYGEDDYSRIEEQQKAMRDNTISQLSYLKEQADYYDNLLNTLDENSDAWKEAQKGAQETAEKFASTIKEGLDQAKEAFETGIAGIFKDITDKLTDGKGFDLINKQWELMNENSQLELDNINRMQGLQDIAKKYNDAINGTSNAKAQKQLAELRDKELEQLKEIGHISEQDLERAEKKLEIVKAQIALEDAQRNKTQMRLRRDSQGNYRYQFVADEDQINQAQNQLAAAYNNLYNFDKERALQNNHEMVETTRQYFEEIANLRILYGDEEEKYKEEKRILDEQYNEKMAILEEHRLLNQQNLNESTFANLNSLYAQNADNYELMTEAQKSALNSFEAANQTAFDLIFRLQTQNTETFRNMANEEKQMIEEELIPQWNSGIESMLKTLTDEGGFQQVASEVWDNITTKIKEYFDAIEPMQEKSGKSFEEMLSLESDIIEKNKEWIQSGDTIIEQYEKMTQKAIEYWKELQKQLSTYKDIWEQAVKIEKEGTELYEKLRNKEGDEVKNEVDKGPETKNAENLNSTPTSTPKTTSQTTPKSTAKTPPEVGTWIKLPVGTYFYDSAGSPYRNPSVTGRTVQIKSTSGNLWKVYSSALNPNTVYIKKSAIGYDTGGYTGEWGKEGKIAMLHEKELVLNKKDTANILNAVDILRGITDNIGADVLDKMASMRANGLNMAMGANTLDQNVHIEATFPGVTSSLEIQDALNNLVNMAAQRAQIK